MTTPGAATSTTHDRLGSRAEPLTEATELLTLGMLRSTEAAALACVPLRESGDSTKLLAAAESSFSNAPFMPGRAPDAGGCEVVIAPLTGAFPGAGGCRGALSAAAGGVAPVLGGAMLLGVRREAATAVDLTRPLAGNLARLSAAVAKPVEELVVAVPADLDHIHVAAQVWAAGARVIQVAGGVIAT
ncbi:MAG: hypothetical protein ACREQ5_18950, partial [Candidatus Dormibacteria bacterium]